MNTRIVLHAVAAAICAMLLAVLPGCGSSGQWEAALAVPPSWQPGKALPLVLTVTEQGKPAAHLSITARLEMDRMEHDAIALSFTEKSAGRYEAYAMLPMGGDWIAALQLAKAGKHEEHVIAFTVKSGR
ncbi:MAG TPA: FixH family protein [Bacilli bacterium]